MFKAEISNSSLEEILECSVPMYKFVIADKRKIRGHFRKFNPLTSKG